MQVTSPPGGSPAPPLPAAKGSSGRPSRRTALLAAAVAALALLLYGGWELTRASAFDPYGSSMATRVPVGETGFFGTFLYPHGGEVTVRDITPVVEENTADAVVEVFLCRQRGEEKSGGWTGEASAECAAVEPVEGAKLLPPPPSDTDVVVSIRPRKEGRVRVEGFEVRYRQGLRWGSQRSGLAVHVSTAPGG